MRCTIEFKRCGIKAEIMEARSWRARMRGLLGRPGLPEGVMMWICFAPSIHTFGMLFTLDLIFLDRNHRVVKVYTSVPPWQVRFGGRGADSVLEAQAGWFPCAAIQPGDHVVFLPAVETRRGP